MNPSSIFTDHRLTRRGLFPSLFIILIALISVNIQATAQILEPVWKNYSTNNGLASSETYSIIQDRKGFIWIATDHGLVKYDGYEFTTYGVAEGLTDPVVFHLHEDTLGRIWMSSLTSDLYYCDRDTIIPYKYNQLVKDWLVWDHLPPLFEISHRYLYVAIPNKGILSVDENGNPKIYASSTDDMDISMFEVDDEKLVAIKYPKPESVIVKKNGFVSTNLNMYDPNGEKSTKIDFHFDPFAQAYIYGLNDGVKVITHSNYLYVIKKEHHLATIPIIPGVIVSMMQTEDGKIYVCNQNALGLRVYNSLDDFINGRFETWLKGVSVTSILRDRNGGFWVTSLNNGIFYSKNQNILNIGLPEKLNTEKITALSNIEDGIVYVGYESGKLGYYNIGENKFYLLDKKLTNPITDVFFDKKYKALYVTDLRYAYCFRNNKWKEILTYKFEVGALTSIFIKRFWWQNDNKYIIGTNTAGIQKIDREKQSIFRWTHQKHGHLLAENRILCYYYSKSKIEYVGRIDGLFMVKNETLVPVDFGGKKLNVRVEAVDQLEDQSLVLGTKGEGLYLIKNNNLLNITEKDGLTSNIVNSIMIDSGHIWVSTSMGLNKVYRDKDSWKIERITYHTGLPSNEVFLLKKFGDIVLGVTNKGLVKIEPFQKVETPVPLTIMLYSINGKLVNNNKFSFPYYQNNITFELGYNDYRQEGNITYRFKLNDGPWAYIRDRYIRFYTLSPGKYSLVIEARSSDNRWVSPVRYSFEIKSPWWQTWIFVTLITTGLLFVVYLFFRRKTLRYKKEIAIQQRLNELEFTAKKAQMNPHFIFNVMNSIQYKIVSGNMDEASQYLSSFGQLIRNVLYMSGQNGIPLRMDVEFIQKYLDLELNRFENKFTYQLEGLENIDTDKVVIAPMLIQPIVENALVHGIRITKRPGEIRIKYRMTDRYLEVEVIDNGAGYSPQRASRDKRKESVGINNTLRRLKLLDNSDNDNLFLITHILDSEGNVAGTRVCLLINITTFALTEQA